MSFTIEFPLKTESWQCDVLDRRFSVAEHIYNSLLNVSQKHYKEMIQTREYRNLVSQLSDDKKNNKVIYRKINDLRKRYGLSEYGLHSLVRDMQRHFKNSIDSNTAQKIATRLWRAYEKNFFSNGKKLHYKKRGSLRSVEGKSNKTGIRFVKDHILWNGLSIPVMIDYKNKYECEAIVQHEVSYCRIIRRYGKNRIHYTVQLIMEGNPPVKYNEATGEVRHPVGSGDVGLDIGPSTIAIVSENNVKLYELADKVQNIEKEKRLLLRKMDRSRRMTNPNNYNRDGTIKTGPKKWIRSKGYMKMLFCLRYISEKLARMRRMQHEMMANYIISLGDHIAVETMNFEGLAKRSTKTEISENTGLYKRKKRFGKSIANRAPVMLLDIVNRKLRYYDKKLIKIDTQKAKASQYNHMDGTYTKKSLSQRWNHFDKGLDIQRDLYSAFLIMNINDDLKTFNIEKCHERFEKFCILHDIEIQRLSASKHVKSFGL
ncbi:MAG: transposase [Clostridium sp.]|nr:MAG: transposase [Clostridium sp.]